MQSFLSNLQIKYITKVAIFIILIWYYIQVKMSLKTIILFVR